MQVQTRTQVTWRRRSAHVLLALALVAGALAAATADAVVVHVVGSDGSPIAGYRWLIQEDTTKPSVPGAPAVPGETLAVSFYTSYSPPVAAGCLSCAANPGAPAPVDKDPSTVALDPQKRYFVSAMPNAGYTIGGAAIAAGQSSVTVVVNKLPLPTAQISVFVFEDNLPINNEPDLPEERGLGGFQLTLIDAGGTYGISGGQISVDVYGNPLGTTYKPCPDPNVGCTPDVITLGTGIIKTDANGYALIQNLAQGKYSIQAIPPAGQDWHQTATIEGTKTIDAWVKPNEPPYFAEFGPPGYHVFIGFVHTTQNASFLRGTSTITGKVVNLHNSRPPDFTFFSGDAFPGAWVGLNELTSGVGRAVYAKPANPVTGEFSIPNVPAGSYQLVIWDEALDAIFATQDVVVPPGGGVVALNDVAAFNWFFRLDAMAFYDSNENGFRDAGEVGLPGQVVNVRFRDGSIYQSAVTDPTGHAYFREVFPFFDWLINEIDYTRFKATGATIIVDAGGQVLPDNGWSYPSRGKLNPQEQFCTQADVDAGACSTLGAPLINPNTGNNLSRTETGPVLLEAIQGFAGQVTAIEYGKKAYGVGENGGITGIVQYATTRAENDPRYAVAEPWEAGIPHVEVPLYRDANRDAVIDDLNGDAQVTLADVDNYPFGWADGGAMGPEDVKRNGNTSCQATLSCVFDKGDAVEVAWTDAWDDNLPSGCQGDVFSIHGVPTDCYDGLRNFNQVRPGVFDGGFAFGTPANEPTLLADTYIVEAVTPPGYETVKEEDKNVDFGDTYTPPAPDLLPAQCVGMPHPLPQYLSLFPDQQVPNPSNDPYVPTKTAPLCNMKQVTLSNGQNAAANFFMLTEVPAASQMIGFILDDLSNEFDQSAPNFGEKYAPPWLPISIQDYTGREIQRVYSDEFGTFNALVPSTFTINAPIPSGVSPNMLTACMNHPGPIQDTRPGSPTFGQMIEDPNFNRQYSQFCYTLQYMPAKTTFLDTPVVPVAAFAGPGQFPLDCEYPDKTPVIYTVSASANGVGGGPWLKASTSPNAAQNRITITSAGRVRVPNPAYDGPGGTQPKTIFRDFGFGSIAGTVRIQSGSTSVPLTVVSWSSGTIVARVASTTPTGEIIVSRGDNHKESITGVTFTVGGSTPTVVPPGGSIQAAIDLAKPDTLILVSPGTYNELVIMWKPVRLQAWGAAATMINAAKTPAEKLHAWRKKMDSLVATGSITLLPGQAGTAVGFPEPTMFVEEEGPGVFVAGKDTSTGNGGFGRLGGTNGRPNSRIDGFTITGGDNGGGIFVNAYAHWLEISNNRILGNQGFWGGGIRVGHPTLVQELAGGLSYVNARNDNISMHNNQIIENGGLGGAGGGISMCTGSDNYRITQNFICGNFTQGDGGGIGHLGLSDGGRITNNSILFNQSFYQGNTVNGGGILIAGQDPLAAGTLSPGSGSVTINANLIQGNLAGAGDGGGIRAQFVNGLEVPRRPSTPGQWYSLDILNNMIVNNVTGLAGGAISLQDVARSSIIGNTIANNDSTATAGEAFTPGLPSQSNPQPAGVVSHAHSTALAAAIGGSAPPAYRLGFSNPTLYNDIVWHSRSFYFTLDTGVDPPNPGLLPPPASPVYNDLAVVGTAAPQRLNPQYCVLTSTVGYAPTNINPDPTFVASYVNGPRNLIQEPDAYNPMLVAAAFDEGGNFIDVRFGPITTVNPATGLPFGNYHLTAGSPAINTGTATLPGVYPDYVSDFDGDSRLASLPPDIGADEKRP